MLNRANPENLLNPTVFIATSGIKYTNNHEFVYNNA